MNFQPSTLRQAALSSPSSMCLGLYARDDPISSLRPPMLLSSPFFIGWKRSLSSSPSPSSPPVSGAGAVDPTGVSSVTSVPSTSTGVEEVATWNTFIYDAAPVQAMQSVLEGIHATTGLPWWGTIALSTLGFRLALLPIVRYQAHAITRLVKSGPYLAFLNQALSKRLDEIKPGDVKSTTHACRAYASGVSAALKLNQVSLLSTVASPLVQLPVFITFALANRRMIDHDVEGLEEEGLAWFQDLTEADPLLILPVVCIASTYANLELGFAGLRESQTILRFLKDNLQLFLILGAPVTSTLPSGVFVYWLTSSLFGHVQHFALKNAAARRLLGFPPIPGGPSSKAQQHQQPPGSAASSAAASSSGGLVVPSVMMRQAIEILEEYEKKKMK